MNEYQHEHPPAEAPAGGCGTLSNKSSNRWSKTREDRAVQDNMQALVPQ